jgi:hypothetical protein
VPPHSSPFAFSSVTPSISARDSTGNLSESLTFFSSSAAAVVTILNTDPGGCGAEKAMPASARTSPDRVSIAAIPPRRPARAVTAACWIRVSMVERTAFAFTGLLLARTRAPARSVPPGLPSSLRCSARSRPVVPTGVSLSKPRV